MASKKYLLVLAAVGLGVVAGCGSSSNDPFGPEPDYSALHTQFDHPTGTFAAGQEGNVFKSYGDQQSNQSNYQLFGGSSSGSGTTGQSRGLRLLDNGPTNSASWCSDLQSGHASGSCSCPSGGSIDYDLSGFQGQGGGNGNGPIDGSAKFRFDHCSANSVTVDGREFLHLHADNPKDFNTLQMLLDAHLDATTPKGNLHIDLDILIEKNKIAIQVSTNDGSVVVSTGSDWSTSTESGTINVKDKNETWTCTLTNGKGTCTSDKGSTRQI